MPKKCLYLCSNEKSGSLLHEQALEVWKVVLAKSSCEAKALLENYKFDYLLIDYEFYEFCFSVKEEIPFLVLTQNKVPTLDDEISLQVPCPFCELKAKIEMEEKKFFKKNAYNDILGSSKVVSEIKSFIDKASKYDFPVVILGETGTGKNLVAKTIHTLSNRKHSKFLEVNVTTIPTTLSESIFFGVSKGAFTGACEKSGLFEEADGGTVFLDEVESMDMSMQGKLLSVIEQKKFTRIGEYKERTSDFRIIVASNESLEKSVTEKAFRKDLYYRLNILPFYIKPLREHPEDIPEIAGKKLKKYNKSLSDSAYQKLQEHTWPGNVRELKNCLMRAIANSETDVISDKDITFSDLN